MQGTRFRLAAAAALAGVLSVVAASGGTTSSAATRGAAVAAASSPCKGVTLNFIGLAGEEGQKELAGYRKSLGMKLQVTNASDWGQVIGAIKVGQPYDLNTIPVLEAQRMIAAKVVQPIDTSKLHNWKSIVPGLRNSAALRKDGKVYGVPIAWGDGPYVYAPKRVPHPPKSIAELLKPEWKGRYTMFDDPGLPFFMMAQAMGYKRSPLLTKAQFAKVKVKVQQLVKNAAAFQTSYQDAVDRMVSGDVDLAVGGWEAMLTFAKQKGVKLAYRFFKESKGGGWWDGLAIPASAKNPDCALAYIDQMISPKVNAKVATDLVSGASNGKSIRYLPKSARIYNYKLVESSKPGIDFVNVYPPEKAPSGYASLGDWKAAWQQIKAG